MRTTKLLSLGVILLAGLASTAEAQNWEGRGYFNVSIGGQTGEQTFTESTTFTRYNEAGALAAGHTIGGGQLFDVSVGARVWWNLGVGIGYSAIKNKNDATIGLRVPHPVIFNQPRNTSVTATDLEHSENVVHLQALWMIPMTDKIQIAVMAGPSFFTVRQQLATVRPADITDTTPVTTVRVNSITLTEVKHSPVGVNVGIDGTYLVRPMIGVGVFMRYAGATLDLPVVAGTTRDEDLKAGGFQGGVGLRLRF